MRIAIYVHDMRASGVVRAMIALTRYLAAQGDEAVLVAGSAEGHFRAEDVAPARFVSAAATLRGPLPRVRVVGPLRQTLRALAPDVILSGGNHGHVSLWAAARGLGIPLVFTFSNPMTRPRQPLRNLWRLAKSRALVAASARCIVAGRNIAEDPAFVPGVAAGKVRCIRNGIDLPPAAPLCPAAPPRAMVGDAPVVLAIGRLHPQKNIEGLIDAVAEANRTRPLRLVVLGDGPADYRAALARRAERLGIADKLVFAGVTDDVPLWLRAADAFAIASWYEAASLALFEAMAAGVPIVASHTAGDAADVLGDGRYGLIVKPDDPVAFAAALLRQTGDDPVRPRDRITAYDAATMMAAYRDLLASARRAALTAPQPVSPSAAALPPRVAHAPPTTPSDGRSAASSAA